jgi:hypothetical protein
MRKAVTDKPSHTPRKPRGVGGDQTCKVLNFVVLFPIELRFSARVQYSERGGSDFTNNYEGGGGHRLSSDMKWL